MGGLVVVRAGCYCICQRKACYIFTCIRIKFWGEVGWLGVFLGIR